MSKVIDVILRLKNEMTKPLNDASRSLQSHANQFKRAGRDIQRTGKSISNVGKSLTRSLTVPIVGVGVASAKLALDFEHSMAQVNTLLDDHSHLEGYEKTVKRISNQLGISAEVSAEGMYQTISTLGDHGKKTEKIFNTMAKAAKAGGADVLESVNMIATAMNGYGDVSNKTAKKLSDLAFQTVKLGKTTFPELAGEMSNLFPLGKSLNISFEELYATMSTATTSFAGSTAEAATQIRGLMSAFLKPSEEMVKLYENLHVKSGRELIAKGGLVNALKAVQHEAGRDGLPKYFRNIRALTAAQGLAGSGLVKYQKHLKEMQKAAGSTGDALATMQETNAAKLEKIKVQLTNALEEIGAKLLPKVIPVIKKVSNELIKMLDKFNDLSGKEQKHVFMIAGAVAALGPALSVLGNLMKGIGGAVTLVGKLGAAISKGGGIIAALTGPVGIVIAALAAVAVAVGVIVKHWDELKESVMGCWKAIEPIIDAFKESFSGLFGGINEDGKKSSGFLVTLFKTTFDVLAKIIGWVAPIISSVVRAVGKVVNTVSGIVMNVFNKLKNFYNEHLQWLGDVIGGIAKVVGAAIEGIANVLSWLFDIVGGIVGGILDCFGGVIDFLTDVFTGDWEAAWTKIKNFFTDIWDAIGDTVIDIINGIVDAVNWCITKISELLNWVKNLLIDFGTQGYNIDVVNQMKDQTSFEIPTIPHLASGTNNWGGGIVQISERGGEIVDLPSGSRVYPHDESVRRAYRDGKAATTSNNMTLNIPKLADKIIVREDADIEKIINKLADTLENVSVNIGSNDIGYAYQV